LLISKFYKYFQENNHIITNNISEADYIIINSCGHTQTSEDLTLTHFEKIYKNKKKDAKIIISGCLIDINTERLEKIDAILVSLKKLEKIDEIFYQNKKLNDIDYSCDLETRNKIIHNKQISSYKHHILFYYPFARFFSKKIKKNLEYLIEKIDASNTAFVKIGQGCMGNCSYCAIKKAKGYPISRNVGEIINDISKVYHPDTSIYLVADDCGSYGADNDTDLIELLYKINEKFPNIKIDLGFLEPIWLKKHPEIYVRLFKDLNIRFVQIPLQSGSNKIVKNMNRRYNVNEIIKIINKIKTISPKTIITTYFITGFPGETFIDLFKTIKASCHFDAVLILPFSERKGTACKKLQNKKSKIEILLNYIIAVLLIRKIILYKISKINFD